MAADLDRAADLAGFERSILNVWPRPRQLGRAVDMDTWATLADIHTTAHPVALAFDISMDRATPPWPRPAGPPTADRGRAR